MSSKDLRVPSFIRYDTGENVTKRKRETKKENVPKKKKKAGRRALDVSRKLPGKCSSAEELPIKQIWIGAIVEKDKGVFSIYFGQDDERNYTEIFDKDNELQDLDYASILGTKKAVEITKHVEEPLIVNTFCRILPRAIAGKVKFMHYIEMASEIRDIIDHKGYELQVRYVSERTASEDQKIATNLAKEALSASLNEQITKEQTVATAINNSGITKKQKDRATATSTIHDRLETNENTTMNEAIENTYPVATDISDAPVSNALNSTNSSSPEESAQSIVQADAEDTGVATTSLWASFGIKNLFDAVSSPFRSRKPSS